MYTVPETGLYFTLLKSAEKLKRNARVKSAAQSCGTQRVLSLEIEALGEEAGLLYCIRS
jgi:hypothetical protein